MSCDLFVYKAKRFVSHAVRRIVCVFRRHNKKFNGGSPICIRCGKELWRD